MHVSSQREMIINASNTVNKLLSLQTLWYRVFLEKFIATKFVKILLAFTQTEGSSTYSQKPVIGFCTTEYAQDKGSL
jgi:hypothetical protein